MNSRVKFFFEFFNIITRRCISHLHVEILHYSLFSTLFLFLIFLFFKVVKILHCRGIAEYSSIIRTIIDHRSLFISHRSTFAVRRLPLSISFSFFFRDERQISIIDFVGFQRTRNVYTFNSRF